MNCSSFKGTDELSQFAYELPISIFLAACYAGTKIPEFLTLYSTTPFPFLGYKIQIPGDIFNCQHVTCDSVFGALSVSCSGFLPHRPRQSSPLPLLHSLSTSKLLSTPFLPPQLVHLSTIFVSENTFRYGLKITFGEKNR
uniref:Uncharacterized protein n=1 Tax=Cacopsylla melanoneura TaxID=428564 RepID=A0A8D8LRE8_9HEMI